MAGVHWKTVTIKLPEDLHRTLELYAEQNGFESLSAAARFAISAGVGRPTKADAISLLRENARAEALTVMDELLRDIAGEIKERFRHAYE